MELLVYALRLLVEGLVDEGSGNRQAGSVGHLCGVQVIVLLPGIL